MSTYLRDDFAAYWKGQDMFDAASALQGDVHREKEGRRTLRFELNGHSFFLKYHEGVGWKEIIKNLLQLRLPILGAANEYNAVIALQEAGVDTMTPVAFGEKGGNPARRRSFIVTEDISGSASLEDLSRDWSDVPPSFVVKTALIRHVAEASSAMHRLGINHRDLYICHFLLEAGGIEKIEHGESFHCYIIDLHRAQIRDAVPQRWLVKDLGGLYYSTMDIGLSKRDYFRFLKAYFKAPLREILTRHGDVLKDVSERACQIYRRDFNREPADSLNR
jgi:heptose I phosphotransferase